MTISLEALVDIIAVIAALLAAFGVFKSAITQKRMAAMKEWADVATTLLAAFNLKGPGGTSLTEEEKEKLLKELEEAKEAGW